MRSKHIDLSIKCVLIATLFVVCAYEVITYTLVWFREPISTAIIDEVPVYLGMNRIAVCSENWLDSEKFGGSTQALPVVARVLSNEINTKFGQIHTHESFFMPDLMNNPKLRAKASQDYTKFYPNNSTTDAYQDLIAIRSFRAEESITSGKVPAKPHYVWPELACFELSPAMKLLDNTLTATERIEGATVIAPSFRFSLPRDKLFMDGENGSSLYISVYTGKRFNLWTLQKDYVKHTYNPNDSSAKDSQHVTAIAVTIQPEITIVHHLEGRKSHCTPVDDNGHRMKDPMKTKIRMCRMQCEEEAIREVFNCTSGISVPSNNDRMYKKCDLFDEKFPNATFGNISYDEEISASMSKVMALKKECLSREDCYNQRYCTEYIIKSIITNTEMVYTLRKEWPNVDFAKNTVHIVNVIWPDTIKNMTEYTAYTAESYFGQVGGIIGIFLGLSFITCTNAVAAFVARKCGDGKMD